MQLTLRMKGKLEAAQNIVLRSRTEGRQEPAFILYGGVNTPLRTNLPDEARAGVALRTPAGQECSTGLDIAIANLQRTGRRKMISTGDIIGTPIAPGGVAEEKTLVGIGIVVLRIEIEKSAAAVS